MFTFSGCATIDHRPPPKDFPKLREQIITGQIWKRCSFGDVACARLYFDRGLCEIHVPENPLPFWIDHERDHCQGKDHVGESTIRDAWERWKVKNSRQTRSPAGSRMSP